MKPGDMIEMVTSHRFRNSVGLLVSIDRRHGADCNRHSRVATVMTSRGGLVTWPLDSHYQIEVVSEAR
jgi:hypothetical protein